MLLVAGALGTEGKIISLIPSVFRNSVKKISEGHRPPLQVEHRGAENTGAVAKCGAQDGGLERGVENQRGDLVAGRLAVERVDVADAAAEDDGVGSEHVDDDGDGVREAVSESLDGGRGERIVIGARDDVLERARLARLPGIKA